VKVIRTPEERFRHIPHFPYTPRYAEISGLRVHYVDEGEGETILCLHGEPTWSFLYHAMIPMLSARRRVIAMDFVGFGRSDKFTNPADYSFRMHRDTLSEFMDVLRLDDVTLVAHGLGGMIGLRLVAGRPERFSRLVILNTALLSGDGPLNKTLSNWMEFVELAPDLPVAKVLAMGLAHGSRIAPDVIAAFEAPFPDASYKAGVGALSLAIPTRPDASFAAEVRWTREGLSRWTKPALVMFSDEDPIFRGEDKFFRSLVPGATDQPEIVIEGAGHFLQLEKGEEISRHILEFMDRTTKS
jgi:haloalkane dehalogenase